MIEELNDLTVTIGLAIALNPLVEPNELLKPTLMLLTVRFKNIKLKSLISQWLMTGKPYEHYKVFAEALAGNISTSSRYTTGARVN